MKNKQHKATVTDEHMLKSLIKQANGFGAELRSYKSKSKKYEYCITGRDSIGRSIKMGGSANWLYSELLRFLTNYC